MKTGQSLSDIMHTNIFSDPPPRVMTIKPKINKWDLIKLKSFCTAKETLNKTKPSTHKKTNPIKKMGRRSKQTILQRRHTLGQKAHEKIFTHNSLLEKCKSKLL